MFDLTDKVAVVTGGNGGIGLGMARGLAGAGAAVVIAARDADKSARAVEELRERGASAWAIAVDVADEASVAAMVAATVERHGRLDILVNNAGMNRRAAPHELTLPDWRQILDTNLTSVFLCCRAAHPVMKRAGGGKIINVSSILSALANGVVPAYAASKGGVTQLTRSMACAWAADNIQVNALCPGFVDTELTRRSRQYTPTLHDAVIRRTPAGRWGTIDDMSGVAVFLASRASDFVTGAAICVDGGYSIVG